jgi:hypothetical protein
MLHKCGLLEEGVCAHKTFWPPAKIEVAGWFVFAITKAAACIAGIGGGGISVPILMGMFGFDTKPAVAISVFSIFVSSLSSFVINFKKMHPDKPQAVLIDYGITSIMMPLVLAGSQVGGLILVMSPSLAIQIGLTITLVFLCIQTVFQAIAITRKENLKLKVHDLPKAEIATEQDLQRQETQIVEPELSGQNDSGKDLMQKVTSLTVEESPDLPQETETGKDKTLSLDSTKNNESFSGDLPSAKTSFITIADRCFKLGESPEKDAELRKLKRIVDREASHA